MTFPRSVLTLACLATPLLLASCFKAGPILATPTVYTLAISPRPTTIAAGATVTFTAIVSGGTNSPNWSLSNAAYGNPGSPSTQTGGSTFAYTAPATPPVYTGAGSALSPGTVSLQASQIGGGTDYDSFVITTPAVAVSITPATASVALGATQVFNGYAIGAVNNLLTPQVNGVAGGSTATGTIAASPTDGTYGRFTYTAPAAIPMTGPTVTVTYVSQADPTKSASATITLTTPTK